MISNERKFYLKGILAKFKEVEGWVFSLSSQGDKEYIQSQGFSGVRLCLVLYVVLPLWFAIETGFNGVPLLVSFLKRRLKRVAPMERKIKKQLKSKKVILPSTGIRKHCKSCDEKRSKVEISNLFKAEKLKSFQGKSKNSRKNFLKRVKRRIIKSIFESVVEEPHMVFTVEGELGPPRSRRLRRMDLKRARSVTRRKEILEGVRKLSKNSFLCFLSREKWEKDLSSFVLKSCVVSGTSLLYQGFDIIPVLLETPFGYMYQRSFSSHPNHNVKSIGSRMMQMSSASGAFFNQASMSDRGSVRTSSSSTKTTMKWLGL